MRRSALFILSALFVITAFGALGQTPDIAFATRDGRVLRIVDGDTIELFDGETVRLLGIDTPEMGTEFAMEAKLLTMELLSHQDVYLETDEQERDAYGRLLAHVYVITDDGWLLVNEELVRAGLAELLFIPPNTRYYGHFQDALSDAVVHRRGMFASIAGEGILSVAELECSLVECVTEVVVVRFVISEVSMERGNVRLDTAEGDYGFHVLFPSDSEAASAMPPVEALLGQVAEVSGILDCTYRDGPSITIDSPDQISYGIQDGND